MAITVIEMLCRAGSFWRDAGVGRRGRGSVPHSAAAAPSLGRAARQADEP